MAANDFNSSKKSGAGQQDDVHPSDGESAFSSATASGRGMFPRLSPGKFAEDDLPAADLPLQDVPPMEQFPVPGEAYHPRAYGPPPSHDTGTGRYAGRTPLPDHSPAGNRRDRP
jgi:hypothetical protein